MPSPNSLLLVTHAPVIQQTTQHAGSAHWA